MKKILLFCGFVLATGLAGLLPPYLDDRDKVYEERLVGALSFTEQAIESALNMDADLFEPAIDSQSDADFWDLSGILVSTDSAGNSSRSIFNAVLENLCRDFADPSCWRVEHLVVDDQPVDAMQQLALALQSDAEGTVTEWDTPVDTSAEMPLEPAVLPPQSTELAPAVASVVVGSEPSASRAGSAMETTAAGSALSTTGEEIPSGESSYGTYSVDESLSEPELILFIQDALKRLSYEPGPLDGRFGGQTSSAIRAYQRDSDLAIDGRPTLDWLRHLRDQLGERERQSRAPVSVRDRSPG